MGYLKPIFSKYLPLEGHWQHGYKRADFDKVLLGYACGNCGEDYEGIYRDVCPVCLFESFSAAERGGDTPPEWRY